MERMMADSLAALMAAQMAAKMGGCSVELSVALLVL